MSKTNKKKELTRGEVKSKKRMYKAKKRWVTAGATIALGLGGLAGGVQADAAWTATTVEEMATRVKAEDGQYTFRDGDTFWAVGQVINIDPLKLMELNGFTDGQQYSVPVGTTIHWDGNHVTIIDAKGNTVSDSVIKDKDKVDPNKPVAGQASDTPKVPVQSDQNGNVINNNSNSNTGNNNANNNSGGSSSNTGNSNSNNTGNGGNGNNTNPVNPVDPTPEPEEPIVPPVNPEEPIPPVDPEKPTDPDPEKPIIVDKSDLQALYDTWKATWQGDYTPESYLRLVDAVGQAKAVLENEDATQAEIDTALTNLQDAISKLEKVPVEEVNKSALETTIQQAEAINAENYTEESVSALSQALEQAKVVYENSEATQSEVNNATTVLANAIQALIEKEPEVQTKTITVNYVDENGAVLATREVSGKESTSATLTAESTILSNSLGFKLADTATKTAIFGKDETVTFNYEKDIRAVAIQAIAGDLVLRTTTVSGQVGTTTTVSSENEITFDGKTYESITQNEQTVIFGTTTSIIFNYVEKAVTPEPTQQFTVTVNHVSDDGVVSTTNSEMVDAGTSYTASALTFIGYILQGESTQTVTVNSDTTITFNYVKNVPSIDLDALASQMASQMFSEINSYRESNGTYALATDGTLQSAVNTRASELFASYTHLRPDGSSPFSALDELGYNGDGLMENIGRLTGTGYSLEYIQENLSTMATQLLGMWQASSDHNRTLLASSGGINSAAVGVSIQQLENGRYGIGFVFINAQNYDLPFDPSEQTATVQSAEIVKESSEPAKEEVEETVESTEEIVESTVETTESIVEEKQESVVESTTESVAATPQSAEIVDKSSLVEAYNIAISLTAENYTEETWNNVILEVANAKAINDNTDATNYQVRKTTEALKEAINNLK